MLHVLRRVDLVKLFRRPIEIEGKWYTLRNRATFTKEALLSLATDVFVGARVPPLLVLQTSRDDDDADDADDEEDEANDQADEADGEDDGDDDADDEGLDEPDDEAEEEVVEVPRALQRLLVGVTHAAWSRPRAVSMLLRALYGGPSIRLRTARFQRLLEDLERFGVEAALVGESLPLANDAISPGIDAQVLLRLHPPARGPVDVTPAPVTAKPPSKPTPPPAVMVVPDPPGALSAVPLPRVNPYELALLRLEFLTAVPSIARGRDAAWPDEFLDAAARGLELDARSQRFLRLASNTFAAGNHDPMSRVMRLTKVLRADEWPLLLLDFERLNPDADEAAVQATVRHAGELACLPQEPVAVPAAVAPAPLRVPLAAATSEERRRAKTAVPARGGDTNQRDMGALKSMFDD
ncbi:MAG: hypothetical protein EPO40_17635 [Myxococcaceae bacterium]|nr:MAG: hypothetical protein EPO40_17635 [Myxococcaceae bacterium]